MIVSDQFHGRPFDEGTLTKLQIFELYAREWLPVFLARANPPKREIHVFDFFAGPGTDSKGELGTPLRLLRQLAGVQGFPGWVLTNVHAHFYDSDPEKIEKLKSAIAAQGPTISRLTLDIDTVEFREALRRRAAVLVDANAAKLLLVDQFGVDNVTPDVFRVMVDSPTCDFLFFLSSSTLHRFRDHPAIKQKINRPDDYFHVHRAALEYYRTLLSKRSTYYLAPFSIKKGANIYGLIFGSAHPLGMDKFLQVAWKEDQISGEADFDIHRDNIKPGQPKFDLEEFRPTKVSAFERELEAILRSGGARNERDVIDVCFRHGVKRQHATAVLSKLKGDGTIGLSFRVPDIRKLSTPRPIQLRG
jgi:three-Cys-motif partner protein